MTLKNIAAACDGNFVGAPGTENLGVSAVTIDSRTVTPGCLFAAIAGERTDGHKYITSALDSGAACVLAEHLPALCEGPAIIVPSTQQALGKIAKYYRQQFDLPVIGITGSVGKTTAKEMVSAVLSQRYNVHKTAGNFNNELGVPLTLFGLREEHTAAVIEMGISDFGEMSRLTEMVQPNYALFTVIGHAHLQQLGDRQGVLRAKSEILRCVPENGTVFINGDDDMLRTLTCPQHIVSFGVSPDCDVRAENVCVVENGSTVCEIVGYGRRIPVEIPAYGEHMVSAALEGAAVGFELGLTDAEIAHGIADYQSVGHRGRVLHHAGMTIIDDCYNANPTSVSAAIRSLMRLPGRKVCILGDMLELGEASEQLHAEIGQLCSKLGVELVLTCGDASHHICQGAGECAVHFGSREELIDALPRYLHAGDAVLVKASNSMGFDRVCQAIEEM